MKLVSILALVGLRVLAVSLPPMPVSPYADTEVSTNVAFLASATESFIYDDDGNLLEDARFRYFWNGENRMIRAEEKLAPPGREPYIVTCAYDHMGRNVMKDGVMFIWDDYNIIVENLGASNETHNIWGLDLDGTMQGAGGVGGLLAVERNGSVAFPAYDANGNITEYVDGSGEILSHCDYSAFGRELIKTGSDDFTYRFSTKPLCRKMGVLEYQLRKYNPWCGRWINRDAIEEDGGLNLYGYVGNGVLMNVDLLGNECFCKEALKEGVLQCKKKRDALPNHISRTR